MPAVDPLLPCGDPSTIAEGRLTVVVEAAATIGPDLSVATRLLATEFLHAFGSPEVREIAPDGALRAWAEQHGIAVRDEIVASE